MPSPSHSTRVLAGPRPIPTTSPRRRRGASRPHLPCSRGRAGRDSAVRPHRRPPRPCGRPVGLRSRRGGTTRSDEGGTASPGKRPGDPEGHADEGAVTEGPQLVGDPRPWEGRVHGVADDQRRTAVDPRRPHGGLHRHRVDDLLPGAQEVHAHEGRSRRSARANRLPYQPGIRPSRMTTGPAVRSQRGADVLTPVRADQVLHGRVRRGPERLLQRTRRAHVHTSPDRCSSRSSSVRPGFTGADGRQHVAQHLDQQPLDERLGREVHDRVEGRTTLGQALPSAAPSEIPAADSTMSIAPGGRLLGSSVAARASRFGSISTRPRAGQPPPKRRGRPGTCPSGARGRS